MVLSSVGTMLVQFNIGDKEIVNSDYLRELEALESKYRKVEQLQAYIESNFYLPTDDYDFEEGLLDGLFGTLDDPYSVYMSEEEFIDFNEASSGSYGGIGIVIGPDDDNNISVVSPIEDTPGERAGILSGDKILKVDGVEVFGDKIDAAVKRMKGEPGTEVVLTILRKGQEAFDQPIERAQIVLKSVKSRRLTTDETIGYIRITSFDEKVYEEFVSHYNELLKQNIQGLVIDLRDNPGGSLGQCVEIADFILGKQVIVYTKDNSGREEKFYSDAKKIDLPITVLVNGGSASASEILTGAIKDSGSGTIIGTQTFGKGLVQTVRPLKDNTGIKLTIAQYFTPNGNYIHGTGITPDVVLELDENYTKEDEMTDNQLQEAIRVIQDKQ